MQQGLMQNVCEPFLICMFQDDTVPPPTECQSNEFRCGDNSCIDISRQCDRTYDCPDGSDEYECGN